MGKIYDCVVLNDKLNKLIKPTTPALGLKFVKNEEELKAVPEVNILAQRGGICTLIGFAIAFNKPFAVTVEHISNMCGGACGIGNNREDFLTGKRISIDFPWHASLETAHEHMMATVNDLPEPVYYAAVVAPLWRNAIPEPDVIILSLEPGAAYHLLAGYENKEFTEINFTFRGEATCVESWNRTFTTGKPGLTLGDRGNRNHGGLASNELRLTMTPADLARALDGVEDFESKDIFYPYGNTHKFPECK